MTEAPKRPATMTLAAHFPDRTEAEWRELAAAVVNKGKPEDQSLSTDEAIASLRTTLEGGLDVEPLYTRPAEAAPLGVPGAMPFTRGRALRDPDVPWDVRQLHDDPDAATTRAAVLADLENGATSVWLHVGTDGIAAAEVAEALADVQLDLAPVVVSSWDSQPAAADALYAVLSASPAASGNLGHDPLGAAARTGGEPDLAPLAHAVRQLDGTGEIRAITVDTRVYFDAGATTVDELGFALATGVAYLRALTDAGVDLADAWRHVEFRVSATADQFLTAAALRALRRCWARIGEAVGIPEADRGARIHVVTATRMFTRDDAWTNILRSTLATFGASLGGADAITVLPFDTVAGLPTPFSRRVARNTQVILAEESNVARVTDPAGGAWAVEALTTELAEAAWGTFQEVERSGGMVKSLANGFVAQRISGARSERDASIARRETPIIGVSMFPLAGEQPLERRARQALEVGPNALVPHRDSSIFEALRDRAAAFTKHHGEPPRVTVPTLEVPRAADLRIAAANLLAAGGMEAVESGGAVDLAATDKGYAALAPDTDVVAVLSDLLDELGAPTA
ncbi:heterodimeric methylmalonyl-CoA mutase small subunit [Knoellia remsis]|uniref:Heterodimeric methylmalonyl-CoA mutase small subunit n=1 Tax=Knoellia remsis TaxID=407159 RepID=A0A2T0UQX5_9MICO|nr:methylmalonyl-CoA mutase subunit beta [Knoellia remsis]PRY60331.1 heterodimeric methylmalonyl-CoA mutase small subunit [Knoellia remsis]